MDHNHKKFFQDLADLLDEYSATIHGNKKGAFVSFEDSEEEKITYELNKAIQEALGY